MASRSDGQAEYFQREYGTSEGVEGRPSHSRGRANRVDFNDTLGADEIVSTVKGHTKQSKRIPYWLWFIIAKSLGIRLNDKDKPILAWILHLMTIVSGTALAFTQIWFSGYDIASLHTESDVVDGTVTIIMTLLYVNLGIYAHRLAYRVFVHPKFLDLMRLHSKTFIKLNAAILIQILLVTFVAVQNISSIRYFYAESDQNFTTSANTTGSINPCQTVEIPLLICQSLYAGQIIYSFFFLLWNGLIATVLVSVARTHTIAIRRFICQLEIDAHLIDQKLRRHFYQSDSAEAKDTLKHYLWLDSDRLKDVLENCEEPVSADHHSVDEDQENQPGLAAGSGTQDTADGSLEDEANSPVFGDAVRLKLKEESRSDTHGIRRRRNPFAVTSGRTVFGRFRRLTEDLDHDDSEEDLAEPYILQDEEILYKHWKLAAATRFSSLALQRWTSVATTTIILWSAVKIVAWLSHKPSVCDVLSFIVPFIILPLLASAYAEVNYEGMKVLQNILPTVKRTSLFRYLYGMPIQMTVYGHSVTYGTMGTVLAAVVAAFLSKIILQELNKFTVQ